MKRFKILKRVFKLPQKNDRFIPTPFPGKFPTRLAYSVTTLGAHNKEVRHRYIGKPSKNRVAAFYNLVNSGRAFHYWAYEFDRTHLIREGSMEIRAGRPVSFNWHWAHPTLVYLYHPFDMDDRRTMIFASFYGNRAFYAKTLHVGKQVMRLWSPVQRLQLAEHVKTYKEQAAQLLIGAK